MKLEDGALADHSQREVIVNPTLRNPVCHDTRNGEGRRDRCTLKVLGLSRFILR
jgi:hypothetical protein